MGACQYGASVRPEFEGVARLLDVARLPPELTTLLETALHLSLTSYWFGIVDVGDIARENPDPPEPLDQVLISFFSDYITHTGPLAVLGPLEYIRNYLRYQVFLETAVCNAPPVNPALNCLHATNITIPGGSNQFVPLGTVPIEPAVYDSWPMLGDGGQRIRFSQHKATISGASGSINWFVQYQLANGTWIDLWRGDGFPEGSTTTTTFDLNASSSPIQRNAPLRIRTNFGAAGELANLDLCFLPLLADPPQIEPQPPLPGLPTVPVPTCTTDQLCAIVLELARSLSRVSGQVADIAAAVGGTDEFAVLSSSPVAGEGQLTLPVGTRAINIELSTLGSGVFTSALGRPRGLMRAGSIRWGDGQGYSKRQFIDAEDFTRLRPQGALTVSYQLINNCSGTLHFLG